MKHPTFYILILLLLAFILIGWKVVGTIFSVGVYTGIFIVVIFIALILFLVVRFGKRD